MERAAYRFHFRPVFFALISSRCLTMLLWHEKRLDRKKPQLLQLLQNTILCSILCRILCSALEHHRQNFHQPFFLASSSEGGKALGSFSESWLK